MGFEFKVWNCEGKGLKGKRGVVIVSFWHVKLTRITENLGDPKHQFFRRTMYKSGQLLLIKPYYHWIGVRK